MRYSNVYLKLNKFKYEYKKWSFQLIYEYLRKNSFEKFMNGFFYLGN